MSCDPILFLDRWHHPFMFVSCPHPSESCQRNFNTWPLGRFPKWRSLMGPKSSFTHGSFDEVHFQEPGGWILCPRGSASYPRVITPSISRLVGRALKTCGNFWDVFLLGFDVIFLEGLDMNNGWLWHPSKCFRRFALEKMIGRRSRYLLGPGKCSGALLVLVDSRVSGNIPVSFLGAMRQSCQASGEYHCFFCLSRSCRRANPSQDVLEKTATGWFCSSQERHPNLPRHQRLKLRECSELNQMEMGRGSGSGKLKVEFFWKSLPCVFLFETLKLDKLEGTPYLYDRCRIFNLCFCVFFVGWFRF